MGLPGVAREPFTREWGAGESNEYLPLNRFARCCQGKSEQLLDHNQHGPEMPAQIHQVLMAQMREIDVCLVHTTVQPTARACWLLDWARLGIREMQFFRAYSRRQSASALFGDFTPRLRNSFLPSTLILPLSSDQ